MVKFFAADREGVASFYALVLVERRTVKFGLKKLDLVLQCGTNYKAHFDISSSLGETNECDGQTDLQTDRHYRSKHRP